MERIRLELYPQAGQSSLHHKLTEKQKHSNFPSTFKKETQGEHNNGPFPFPSCTGSLGKKNIQNISCVRQFGIIFLSPAREKRNGWGITEKGV